METNAIEKIGKKWVLVTGGTRGIGRGLVVAFCAAGYDVVFTYQRSHDAAAQLVHEMKAAGAHAAGHCCDSADEQAVNALARHLLVERGAPHAVINNVGITRDGVLMRMSGAQWTDVVNANLNASFYATRAFVHSMVEQGDGVILQMSSVSGFKGNIGQTNYSATKAAMIGMTRSLALELARFNVRVNAIAPGFIATEMTQQIPDAKLKALGAGIPLRRFGTVREVASLATYLASSDSAYITGQTFVIDGGLTA
jgi:3-oxoacyl-[acyl-carrier protein] reductase